MEAVGVTAESLCTCQLWNDEKPNLWACTDGVCEPQTEEFVMP